MNPEQIEKSIKRLLSDAENIAVSRLRRELPADRRKQEKILGRARKGPHGRAWAKGKN